MPRLNFKYFDLLDFSKENSNKEFFFSDSELLNRL